MKTAERILETARDLFNTRGESNVTAADVALELDMSPGNLYYHFKGKDSLNTALFAAFQRQLAGYLSAPLEDPTLLHDRETDPIERSWLYLTVILEAMYDHRYLYLNLSDLMQRYADLDRGMRRLLKLKRSACQAVGRDLMREHISGSRDQRLERVVDAMALTLTYWLSYDHLMQHAGSRTLTVHRGVLQILSFPAPYLGSGQQGFYSECEHLYARMVDAAP